MPRSSILILLLSCLVFHSCQRDLPFPHVEHTIQLEDGHTWVTIDLPLELDSVFRRRAGEFPTKPFEVVCFSPSNHVPPKPDTLMADLPDTLVCFRLALSERYEDMDDSTMFSRWMAFQSALNTSTDFHITEKRDVHGRKLAVMAYSTPGKDGLGRMDYLEALTMVNGRGLAIGCNCLNYDCEAFIDRIDQCLNTLRVEEKWAPDRPE